MPGRNSQFNQSAAIQKVIEAQPHAQAVREHLNRVLESTAFRGSERSREFLMVIVEKALAGHFEELKERVLGVELFGRDTSYDTGEDAVVRVTASDVRKRLLRYYSEPEAGSGLRLDIPVGSYIPDFHWTVAEPPHEEAIQIAAPATPPTEHFPAEQPTAVGPLSPKPALWILVAFLAGALISFLGVRSWEKRAAPETLPWSSLLQTGHRLQIILSDTEISKMQNVLGYSLSLSDYANRKYLPQGFAIPADLSGMLNSFRGLSMGATDVSVALSIAKLGFPLGQQTSFLPARSVQLKDFRSDDNFVLLGSPRSDPWVTLFQDQMDFQFVYDPETSREVIKNVKPRKGELPLYKPSAKGWDTGEAFGVIAFLANPNQSGHILLLAGSSAEATEAAAKFVLNQVATDDLLRINGVSQTGTPASFQVLLRVNTMAGSANTFEAVAFHRL